MVFRDCDRKRERNVGLATGVVSRIRHLRVISHADVAAAGAASLGPAHNNDTDTGGRVRYVRFRRVTVVNFVEKLFDRSGPNLALCMRQDPQSTLVCRKISSGSVYSVVNFEKRSDRSGPNLTPRSRPTVHACARDFVGVGIFERRRGPARRDDAGGRSWLDVAATLRRRRQWTFADDGRPCTLAHLTARRKSTRQSGTTEPVVQTLRKGSPYSTTERRVPGLIPVLGSQPAGDVSHKPGGRRPLLSARPAVTLATLKRAATIFAAP